MNTSQLLLVSAVGLGINLFGMFATGGHAHHGVRLWPGLVFHMPVSFDRPCSRYQNAEVLVFFFGVK